MNKGMHRMPDGTMMKDSEHKGMEKGGVVKAKKTAPKRRGDGCITKGRTKGRMV